MKQLILVLSIAGFVIACNNTAEVKSASYAKNTDIIQQNLKGKVQEYQETSYTVDSTGKNKMDSLVNVNDFDQKGYMAKYQTKDSSGKIHTDQSLSHDADGNMTEMTSTNNGKQDFKLVTEIKDGKYTGAKSYDSTGKQDSYYTDLATNDNGVVYAGKQHFMDGRIKSSWDYKFDGPIYVSGSSTDSTGKASYSGSVKVNDKGDPISEISTTRQKDSTKTENMTYKYDSYDDTGNWTQRTTYNDKGKPTKVVKRTYSYYKD
ncbi:MAG TPA: hypothetical protein VGG71_05425 [Chitinophagaceae bacterium]